MKKMISFLKKNWITAWLLIAVIGAISFVAYAEYMEESNRAKRVIANTTGAGDLFSSDYLAVGGESEHEIEFSEPEGDYCELPVRIWNYDASNPAIFYDDKDITYTLVALLVKKNAAGTGYDVITDASALSGMTMSIKKDQTDSSFTNFSSTSAAATTISVSSGDDAYDYTVKVDYDSTNGYRVTYTGVKLLKSGRDENKYLIRFPKSMRTSTNKIYVRLTASPTPSLSSYKGIKKLSGVLSVTESKEKLSQGWSYGFNDSEGNSDYDGFNYVISGNGTATITLKWRDDKFEINPYFLSSNIATIPGAVTSSTVGGITWKSITINANSEVINRYDIQFYMKDAQNDNYPWNSVKTYVDCSVN